MRRPSNTLLNNLAFAVALAILALLAWEGKRTQEALLRHSDAERASLELITVIQGMLSSLQDVETGARGYLLTGSAPYLEPYETGRRQLVDARRRLGDALLARNPANARWLAALDRDIEARLRISAENIRERDRAGLVPAAEHLVRAGGKELMDRLRERLAAVESLERARLGAARLAVEQQYRQGRSQLLVGGIIVSLLLVGGLLAMNRNLRARRQLVLEAQSQRGFLRSVIDADENLIYVRDASGRFTLCNRAFAALLGSTSGEVEGRLPAVREAEGLADLLDGHEALLEGAPDLAREVRVVDVAGMERWLQLHKQAITLPDGARAVLAVAADVSARHELDRMKSEFVSTVSHELRTPLTAIRGALGMVIGGMAGDVPDASQPLLAIADKNSQRLVSLINDILDIEKLDAGRVDLQLQDESVGTLLEHALEQNAPYAAQFDVTLALRVADDAWVRVDPDRFAQVMANLLSNAIKHSPRGGEVVVDARRRDGHVEVGVRDHGAGIPADFQSRIFQRFAQADASDARRRGGTGLGLAITKALVEQHGGDVGFDTTPGAGTRFHFTLPLADEAARGATLPGAAEAAAILVVDDDTETAAQLAGILQASGYRTEVAGSGVAAREQLAGGAFAGLAVNLALGDEDALGLIAGLRAKPPYRHLPVLGIVVQSADAGGPIEGSALGIGDWLRKPFDAERVVQSVRACIDGAGRTPQVLHVEDDADLRTLVAGLLEDLPLVLHGAASLAEARAALAVRRHDLVILDLGLPDGDGSVLLEELSAARPSPRVIIFSARDTPLPESVIVLQRLVKATQGPQELALVIREQLRRWPRATAHPGGNA